VRAADYRFLSVTIFERGIGEIDHALTGILRRLGRPRMVRYEAPLNLDEIYVDRPPSGGAHLHRLALYEPVAYPGATAMVVNLRDGWSSMVGLIAREHAARQVQVVSTHVGAAHSQNLFRMWVRGEERRFVMAMRDTSTWVFEERGAPLPFERPEDLTSARISERLNRRLVLSYLANLGWDVRNSTFWVSNSPATSFEQVSIKH
jgi:hypothetical protein